MVVTNYRMSEAAAEQPFSVLDGVIGKEVLLCYICAEYYKDPRVLPCQHTFCRGCLQRYFDQRQAESSGRLATIPCPNCQANTQVPQIGVTGFPLDTKLRQMKEAYLNVLKNGKASDTRTSQHSDTLPNGGKMPYSAQDKENIGNGRFAYRRREAPGTAGVQGDQDRPSSWYGQTTTDSSGTRPSPRSSWYAGSASAKKEESPGVDPSKNPFDRSSRFAPRRRRKMERTFETNDEKVGFKPRDRLEEIINNVREGSSPQPPGTNLGHSASASKLGGSYRDRFFGSAENVSNGDSRDSPGATRKRNKSPTRSHSFNMQRPKTYEPRERFTPRSERSGSFQYNQPTREEDTTPKSPYSFDQFGSTNYTPRKPFGGEGPGTATPTGTGTPVPPPRRRSERSAPRSPSATAKPSPEPPKFKPKPPPMKTPPSSFNPSYEAAAHKSAFTPVGPQLSPGLRRSESEPPFSSFFGGQVGGFTETSTPQQGSRSPRAARAPAPAPPPEPPAQEPVSPKTKAEGATTTSSNKRDSEIPGPPPEDLDDESRELYEKMRDYYRRRAEEPPKDIPDIESLMKDSSSESEDSDTEDFDTKTGPARPGSDGTDGKAPASKGRDTETGPTCNGTQSPGTTGHTQHGASTKEHNNNVKEPGTKLSSDTFATFNIGPTESGSKDGDGEAKAEEAFAEVGEMHFENQTIKLDSGSDYDNASDYDNLETVPDEILMIVEDGDEVTAPPISPKRRSRGPSVTEEIKIEIPLDPPSPVPTASSPSQTEESSLGSPKPTPPPPQFVASLLWTHESSEYEMPTSVAFTTNAHLVVAEYSTGCLQFFDEVGGVQNKVEGIKPFAIAVNKAGHIIVGDRKAKSIRVFDEFGYDVMQWEDNLFKWLCGIGTLSDGNFITFDREFCKIRVSSPDGSKLREFGTYGIGDTQFTQVDFLTVDSKDRIIVCDSGNHCVKMFDSTGKFLGKFGSRGSDDGQLEWPKGICVDAQDNIILTDSKNKRVCMFSPDGEFIQHLVTDCPNIYNVAYANPGILGLSQYSLSGKSQVSVYTL